VNCPMSSMFGPSLRMNCEREAEEQEEEEVEEGLFKARAMNEVDAGRDRAGRGGGGGGGGEVTINE
jgi:hypothetical protein